MLRCACRNLRQTVVMTQAALASKLLTLSSDLAQHSRRHISDWVSGRARRPLMSFLSSFKKRVQILISVPIGMDAWSCRKRSLLRTPIAALLPSAFFRDESVPSQMSFAKSARDSVLAGAALHAGTWLLHQLSHLFQDRIAFASVPGEKVLRSECRPSSNFA